MNNEGAVPIRSGPFFYLVMTINNFKFNQYMNKGGFFKSSRLARDFFSRLL